MSFFFYGPIPVKRDQGRRIMARKIGSDEVPYVARICRESQCIVRVQAGDGHPTRDTYICATEEKYETLRRMCFRGNPQPRILRLGDLEPVDQ